MIQRDRIVQTFLELVAIDSPSGDEEAIAAELERRFQALGRNCQRYVGSGQPVLGEPEIVQHRRARLEDRPAHHGGEQETVGRSHWVL